MSRDVSYATANVGYPVFCAEFDPYNRGYLVVGGGGSENRNGVPNKITTLDTTSHKKLRTVAEIDLSKEEDCPQSLSSLAVKDGLITFAGINSSSASQRSGKNEHLRSFEITYPPRKSDTQEDGKTSFLAKTALFNHQRGTANKTYQRLLRLSPVQKRDSANKRIGAVASGMADKSEVVIFDATNPEPSQESVAARLKLPDNEEANDLDVWEPEPSKFNVVWCTDYDVYLYTLDYDFATRTTRTNSFEPSVIYSRPTPTSPGARVKLRCIRWLSNRHLLVLQNQPRDEGTELFVLSMNGPGEPARVILRKILSNKIKSCIGLEVAHLDADPASGERQMVIAVLAKGGAIPILTLNHVPSEADTFGQISKFSDYETIPSNLHKIDITSICFSNFFAPRQPSSSPTSVATKTQYLQFASVSMGGTVVVCNIPLTSQPTKPSNTTAVDESSRNSPNVRYVLSNARQERFTSITGRILIGLFVLVFSIALRAYMNADPDAISRVMQQLRERDPFVFIREEANRLESIRDSNAVAASVTSFSDEVSTAITDAATAATSLAVQSIQPHRLRSLFHSLHHAARDPQNHEAPDMPAAIHIAASSDSDEVHAVAHAQEESVEQLRARGARTFDELSKEEQRKWKERLSEAGHWAEDLPVTLLKGVLFSEYAGVVGGALRDAILQG